MRQAHLIDTIVNTADVDTPTRILVLVAGLDHHGQPMISEQWINLLDQAEDVDAYTKQADLGFLQQGLTIQAVLDNMETDDEY